MSQPGGTGLEQSTAQEICCRLLHGTARNPKLRAKQVPDSRSTRLYRSLRKRYESWSPGPDSVPNKSFDVDSAQSHPETDRMENILSVCSGLL